MYATFIIDSISAILLMSTFYLLWREKLRFYSLRPLLPAIVLLVVSHMCDMLVEHPSIRLSEYVGMPIGSFESIIDVIGNSADAVGISFLIFGFMKIIKNEQAEERHIQELEQMLPLCANCKKFRTEDGQWLPIEKYLIDSGAPTLTHGICPECADKLYGDTFNKQR